MIILENVCKKYETRHGYHTVLSDVNMTMKKGEKLGILGRNGAGKSTLIRLISGSENPTSGRITRTMGVSWPLAFTGGFQGSLTGLDNFRFICRVYGTSWEDKVDFVQDFSELGKFIKEPVKNYSSGMRARLAFAVSMSIEFDCFLIDETISVGDSRFHEKCRRELFEKRADRSLIIVSHEHHNIKEHCDRANVIKNGTLHQFADIDSAYEFYNKED